MDERSEFWVLKTTLKFAFSHFSKGVTVTTFACVGPFAVTNDGNVHGGTHEHESMDFYCVLGTSTWNSAKRVQGNFADGVKRKSLHRVTP